jgi:hypothetical protein
MRGRGQNARHLSHALGPFGTYRHVRWHKGKRVPSQVRTTRPNI